MSPTKIEDKEYARKHLAETTTQAPVRAIRDPQLLNRTGDVKGQDGLLKDNPELTTESSLSHRLYRSQPPESAPNTCISSESATYENSFAEQNPVHARVHESTVSPARVRLPQFSEEGKELSADNSTRLGIDARMFYPVVDLEDKQILLNKLLDRSSSSTQLVADLERQSLIRCWSRQDSNAAGVSVVAAPLCDIAAGGFLEVRPPNEQERREFRAIKPYLLAGNISDLRLQKLEPKDTTGHSFQAWLRMTDERQDTACNDLARSSTDTSRSYHSVRKPANSDMSRHGDSMIAACVDIIQTISQKSQLGSRPYGVVPEYAVDRSIGPGRYEAKSLFETDDEQVAREPQRLARDPRHQPRLPSGVHRAFDVARKI